MNIKLKKFMLCALTMAAVSSSGIAASADDSRKISASDHWITSTSYGGTYATGFVTDTKSHYTNVRVFNTNEMKESGRVWGTGKVSASTDSVTTDKNVGSAVYYGY